MRSRGGSWRLGLQGVIFSGGLLETRVGSAPGDISVGLPGGSGCDFCQHRASELSCSGIPGGVSSARQGASREGLAGASGRVREKPFCARSVEPRSGGWRAGPGERAWGRTGGGCGTGQGGAAQLKRPQTPGMQLEPRPEAVVLELAAQTCALCGHWP